VDVAEGAWQLGAAMPLIDEWPKVLQSTDIRRSLMSAKRNRESHAAQPDHDHLDNLLDQALADSFPASDPVAIDFTAPTKRARAAILTSVSQWLSVGTSRQDLVSSPT
jgi:hypothetical protein